MLTGSRTHRFQNLNLLSPIEIATLDRWELERRARGLARTAYLGQSTALCRSLGGRSLSEAAATMPRFAQAKENVPVSDTAVPERVTAEVERLNAELGGAGRVLVRPSGTEQMVRVMVEVPTHLTSAQKEKLQEFAELCNGKESPLSQSFFEKAKKLFK